MGKSSAYVSLTRPAASAWSRRSLLAALALLPAAARTQPAQRDIVIPFSIERNNLWTQVHIEGKGPYRFAISLGAAAHHVAPDLARKLRLEPIAEGDVGGGARKQAAYLYKAKELRVADALTQSNSILIGAARSSDLIDGAFVPAFKGRSVGYDFERKLLTLRPGPPAVSGFTAIPMVAWDPAKPNDRRVRVKGEVDGRPAVFFIDSGGDESVLLLPEFVRRHGLWNSYPKSIPAEGHGAAGPFRKRDVRFSRLKLGDVVVDAPTGGMIDPAEGFGVTSGDAVIGLDLLRLYDVWADLDGGMLHLRRNALPAEPLHYNRSGLEVAGTEELSVGSVAPGSPGDKAGVRTGDGILLTPGPDLKGELLWRLQGPPGSVVDLQLVRNGAVVPVSLTLEELL